MKAGAVGAGSALLFRGMPVFAADDNAQGYGGFKVGIQSYSLRGYSVEDALKHSKKLNLKYWEAYPRHLPMGTLPAHTAKQKAMLDAAGITLAAYGVIGFSADETKAREAFDYAKAMGLMSISANPAKNKETFDLLEKLTEEYKIPIAIHNHGPGALYDKVSDILEMVEGRSNMIGACVDTGHYLRSDEDPVDVIQQLGKRVHGIHLKDVRTIRSEEEKERLLKELPKKRANHLKKEGKIFTILGEGELNIVGVLRALRNLEYDKNLSLEYEENPENPLSDIEICYQSLRNAVNYLDSKDEGFVQLWDGKTFDGWKINENEKTWSIKNGTIVCKGDRSHLFYMGDLAPMKDFELKVDVKAMPNSNAGIYFHTKFQDSGWPAAGFETQVNNTYNSDPRKTGSLYAVKDVHEQLIPDNTWWTQHIIVKGKRVIIMIDGKVATDYTEPEGQKPLDKNFSRLFGEGTIALQGHDPGSTVAFKNIRLKKM